MSNKRDHSKKPSAPAAHSDASGTPKKKSTLLRGPHGLRKRRDEEAPSGESRERRERTARPARAPKDSAAFVPNPDSPASANPAREEQEPRQRSGQRLFRAGVRSKNKEENNSSRPRKDNRSKSPYPNTRNERPAQSNYVEFATDYDDDDGEFPSYEYSDAADNAAFDPSKAEVAEDSIKLQKVLSDAGIGSRRDMEELIISGRVSVNSMPAHIGQRINDEDHVRVNGKILQRKRLTPAVPRVVIYHKPAGEIVSHSDPEGRPTVFDKLPFTRKGKWLAVGRLDFNTEGLLILTTSGDLANRMMHPRYGHNREYAVRVMGEVTDAQFQQFKNGIKLDDGMASFSAIERIGGDGVNRWLRVVIGEGRNREVRRMFEAIGVTVSRLIRVRFGPVVLPSQLKRGRWEEWERPQVLHLMNELGLKIRSSNTDKRGNPISREREDAQPAENAHLMSAFGVSHDSKEGLTGRGQSRHAGNNAGGSRGRANTERSTGRPSGGASGSNKRGGQGGAKRGASGGSAGARRSSGRSK
ncbi:MAG: pseudouridine synthase [Formosimonas sp.]|jgi:23S rRNA pseudouridine2605 synthase